MLDKIARHLGFGSPEPPTVAGMQVLDHRIEERKGGNTVIALCHKVSMLFTASFEEHLPDEKRIESVNLTEVYPSFKSQYALHRTKNLKEPVCIKRNQILSLLEEKGLNAGKTTNPSVITTHEATICDRLGFEAHPNIAAYWGVQVSDQLEFDYEGAKIHVPLADKSITGLVFSKYDCTLDELVIRRQKFDVRVCLKSIAAAIQHLHKMTLVHGNLNAHNIYVKRGKKGDHFVLGDFSSAHNTGGVITFKTGHSRWCRRKRIGVDKADEEDDWHAFRKLTEWLVNEIGGKVEDYAGIEASARR